MAKPVREGDEPDCYGRMLEANGLITFGIISLGLTPAILSMGLMRRTQGQVQERLRLAMESVAARPFVAPWSAEYGSTHRQYVEGLGFVVGDITCQFNARSSYLRCAINPSGPCESCSHYQSRL